jgi:hypothetical protein
MADLVWFLVITAAMSLVAWVSYRAGYDSASREADYTISNLRRSIRVLKSEVELQANRRANDPRR